MTEKEPRIIRGRYFEDILAQPAAIEKTLAQSATVPAAVALRERLTSGGFKRIVLTGMGSSFYSLFPLYFDLVNHDYETTLAETSELIHYLPALLRPESLVVAVSQSGRSAEILRLLELIGDRGTVLAITNTAASPLAAAANAVMLTQAGDEFSVASKTYVCTLAVVQLLAAILCEERYESALQEQRSVVPLAASYLDRWQDHVLELAPHFVGREHLFFVGRGASLAAAGTGALITKESVAAHAEAMSSAAFRHGPMEILGEHALVAVLEGVTQTRDLNERLVQDVSESPAKALLLGYHAELSALRIPPSSPRVLPILEVLPLEMMTLALGYLLSVEAGVFQRGTKVTVTE